VRSVASIFVSRLDSRIDPLIPESAKELRGQLGIANARSCYALWSDTFGASAFADIRASGGHPPSCLWASTGNKNPDFKDVRYVEELIGPATVNTVPEVTLKAFAHHGQTGRTLDTQLLLASSYLDKAATLGLNLDQIGDDLQKEGLEQFDQAFDRLLRSVS
jgi:transaldolase